MPEEDEEVEGSLLSLPSAVIPALDVGGVPVRVMMGCAFGVSSPVKVFAETLYVEAQLRAGQRIALPAAEERAVYVAEGALKARQTQNPRACDGGVLRPAGVVLKRPRMRIAIVGRRAPGRTIHRLELRLQPQGPYRAGQAGLEGRAFSKVVGDESDFIPLPE